MGYSIEQFTDEINSFLICKICENVFMKPSLADCGCTFCESCCQSLKIDGLCPAGHPISSNSCKQIRTISAMVDSLKVRCVFSFTGCKEAFCLVNYESHTKSCKFNPVNNVQPPVVNGQEWRGETTMVAGSDTTDAGSTGSHNSEMPNYKQQISDLQLELQLSAQSRDKYQSKFEELKKQYDRLNAKHAKLQKEFEEIKATLASHLYKEEENRLQMQTEQPPSYQTAQVIKYKPCSNSTIKVEDGGQKVDMNGSSFARESDEEICTYGTDTPYTHYDVSYKPLKKRRRVTNGSSNGHNQETATPLEVVSCPDTDHLLGFGPSSPFMERLVDKLKVDGALQDPEIEQILKLVDFRSDLIYDCDLFLSSFYEDIKLFVRILESSKSYLSPGAKVSLISSDISIPLALEARCMALMVGTKGKVHYHVPNDCVPYAKKELEGSRPFGVIDVFGRAMVGQDLNFVLENGRVRQRQPKDLMARMSVGGSWLVRIQKAGDPKWDWIYFKRTGYESAEKVTFVPFEEVTASSSPEVQMVEVVPYNVI